MPTEITFPTTGPWNMTKYFSWNEDTTYGDVVTASPSYTGWLGVTRIELSSDIDVELFYESGSGFTYYKPVDKSRSFSVNVDFGVADIALFQWMTTLPNFSTPANTLAKTRTFAIVRKIAKVAVMTEETQLLRNCVPTSLEINLVQGQIVSGRATLVPRLISTPIDPSPLTTPTIPAAGSLSNAIWRSLDAGTGAITVAATAYPVVSETIRWDYGWALDRVWGTELLDAAALAWMKVSGTMTVISGKDTTLRTKVETGALQGNTLAHVAKMKSAAGTITLTDMTFRNLRETLDYGSSDSTKETFDFDARTGVFS